MGSSLTAFEPATPSAAVPSYVELAGLLDGHGSDSGVFAAAALAQALGQDPAEAERFTRAWAAQLRGM